MAHLEPSTAIVTSRGHGTTALVVIVEKTSDSVVIFFQALEVTGAGVSSDPRRSHARGSFISAR